MSKKCPYEKKCGGCQYIDLTYEEETVTATALQGFMRTVAIVLFVSIPV